MLLSGNILFFMPNFDAILLKTPRLLLRPLIGSDAATVFALRERWSVNGVKADTVFLGLLLSDWEASRNSE